MNVVFEHVSTRIALKKLAFLLHDYLLAFKGRRACTSAS